MGTTFFSISFLPYCNTQNVFSFIFYRHCMIFSKKLIF